jgi:hypothetical protein
VKRSLSYPVFVAVAGLLLQGTAATAAGTPKQGIGVAARPTPLPEIPDPGRSEDGARLLKWIIDSGDNLGLPFLIVDKIHPNVIAFHPDGSRSGSAAALIGLARGDVSPPGIGQRRLADISPAERITPAGRFIAALGNDLGRPDVLWVDYNAGISLHRVITGNPTDRRKQRLATATSDDNRISYGCINVPLGFCDRVVGPLFAGTNGVVYILPESRPLEQVFNLSGYLDAVPVVIRAKSDTSEAARDVSEPPLR